MADQKGIVTINEHSVVESATEDFRPTPAMKVYLDTAIQMVGEPVVKICEEAQIAEQTYYAWKKLPGWYDWYVEEYKKRRHRLIPMLDDIAVKYAKRGSYQHLELLNGKAGDLPQKSPETAVQVNLKVANQSAGRFDTDEDH